jgi:SAM-dependent methyltransferase
LTLHDPSVVRAEYEDETRLAARKAAYAGVGAEGPDAREVLLEAIAQAHPRRILEIGCGEGELAERMQGELEADVVAIDQSPRMVELTRRRGVETRVGRAERLEFDEETFDCVVAAWMLYHVHELNCALAEITRVLRPGGRLVAVTNGRDHLKELYELIGRRRMLSSFMAEDAEEILSRHFSRVERRDAHGWVVFPDAERAQKYVSSLVLLEGARVPRVEGAIRVRRLPTIFVAEK